jgi:hypothetical protein
VRLRLAIATVVLIGVISFLAVPTFAPATDKSERVMLQLIDEGKVSVPVVRGNQVTFFAEGDGGLSPRLVSDLTGWGERPDGTFDFNVGKMHLIGGTNWYSLTANADAAARIEYLYSYGAGDYRLDPRNPRKAPRVGGDA